MSKKGLKYHHRTLVFPVASEVKEEATQGARQIFNHWTRLSGVLRRYEAVLYKRWNKKSIEQERKVLVAAWPEIVAITPSGLPGSAT